MRCKAQALTASLLFALFLWAPEAQSEVVSPAINTPAGPAVQDLECLPDIGQVNVQDTYRVRFRTADTIPVAGGFRITFPENFGVGSVGVSYSDLPGIDSVKPDYQSVLVYLDATGTPAPGGTQLELVLTGVDNPTLAWEFSIALEVFDATVSNLYGPTLSRPFLLAPDAPASVELLAGLADTVAAGGSLQYGAQIWDQFGNLVTGWPVTYSVVPGSLGVFDGDIFSARKTGQGLAIVQVDGLADSSGPLVVVPGPLSAWVLSGVPFTVVAGAPASGPGIQASALDAYDNPQFLHADTVYFSTGDTLAELPDPFVLTAQDSGSIIFPGSAFIWYTAGTDSLRVSSGGVSAVVSLAVLPAAAVDFALDAPDTVVAGTPFTLTVTNMRDVFGNPTGGVVTLETSQGDSLAPNGQVPSLPAVSVISGQASTQVALYNAGAYPIFGRLGGLLRQTSSIRVLPEPAASFRWTETSPLVVGQPVDSPFTLTALDKFGNRVVHYHQVGSVVSLSASTGGPVSPGSLAPTDFSSGVVALHARNFTYLGAGGTVQFQATTTGASGVSAPVQALALFTDSLVLDQLTVRRGVDALSGRIHVRVLGLGSVNITGFELATSRGDYTLSDVTPALPAYLTGTTSLAFDFSWPVLGNLAEGPLRVTCRTLAQYPTGSAVNLAPDSVTVNIVRAAVPAVLSVIPGTVAYDDALYRVSLTNQGGVGVSLRLDSSQVVFANGSRRDTARAVAGDPLWLGPLDTVQVEYLARHAASFTGDTARATWQARGTELGHAMSYSVSAPMPFAYVSPAQLVYIAGSLSPDTAVAGLSDTLRLRIRNSGGAIVTGTSARLDLMGPQDTVRADVYRMITPFSDWLPGDTMLAFVPSADDFRVKAGKYRGRITVTGRQNRLDTVFFAAADSLLVVDQPVLLIDSLRVLAKNPPFVSVGQACSLSAVVVNKGSEVIDSVRVLLEHDGGSRYADTFFVGTVNVGATRSALWRVTADTLENGPPFETFRIRLISAVGRVSRQFPELEPAVLSSAVLQVQTNASIQLQARLYGPAGALDGRIAAGTTFQVAGKFVNTGEAEASGARLTLATTGGVVLESPGAPEITVAENVDAIWTLRAPNAATASSITVSFAEFPLDNNTGDTLDMDRDTMLALQIVFEAPPLTVSNVVTQGGAVSGAYEPLTWTWSNGDPTGLFPILVKKFEVKATAADGVTLLDAALLVESAQLELPADTFPALIQDSVLVFGTDSLARLLSGQAQDVHIRVWPRLSGELTEFRWATWGWLWEAVERSVGGQGLSVPVLDERGASLDIVSEPAFIPGREVVNYPNPFKAGSEVTHIQYDLSSAAQVDIVVYSVSGHQVWRYQASAGSAGGLSGPNTVDWDGRNGRGDVVVDGVYFAKLQASGLDATLKIVVMK